MPIFSKLLLIAINPRAVIAKKDHKTPDYNRFTTLREHGKNVDKQLSQAAHDFVALHTQLLEELPVFLEGYMQILDLALVAWAQAQARYHAAIRADLQTFAAQWLPSVPIRNGVSAGGEVNLVGDEDLEPSLDGRAVVKIWHEGWQPYAEALDRFECTRHGKSYWQAWTDDSSFTCCIPNGQLPHRRHCQSDQQHTQPFQQPFSQPVTGSS